jgi:hypothetical protein
MEDEMLLASAYLNINQLLHDWRADFFVNLRVWVGISVYSLVVSCQADKSSCGVFALAFAVEVALGADPSTIVFVKEAQMKDHLKGCLRDLELKPFPKTSTSKVQPTRQKVWKITC